MEVPFKSWRVAFVTFLGRRITKKDTFERSRLKFARILLVDKHSATKYFDRDSGDKFGMRIDS